MPGIDEVVRQTALSHRQVDHWTRKGYLRATNPGCGQGHARDWPAGEVQVARCMARLVGVGITPEAAHRVARGELIGPGIELFVDGARP